LIVETMNVNISGGIFEFTQGRRWRRYRHAPLGQTTRSAEQRTSLRESAVMNLSMKAARAEFKSVTDGARLELRMKRTPVVEVLRSVRFVILL